MDDKEIMIAGEVDVGSVPSQGTAPRDLLNEMSGSLSEVEGVSFNCPVCGAEQTPAEECRRCRADLALYMRLRLQVDEKRTRCLALIQQRRLMRATQLAIECVALSADDRNLRLLVTCYLLQGDFANALRTLTKAGIP